MHDRSLRLILARYPASEQPTASLEALGNAGGLSGSRLWRYEAGVRRMLLRCWPAAGLDLARLRQIHEWLQATRPLPFVPRPVVTLDGVSIVEQSGRLWQIEPWMPGAPAGDHPSVAQVRVAFSGLASFHQSLSRIGVTRPSPGLTERLGELRDLRQGGFAEAERVIELSPNGPFREHAFRWLALARRLAVEIEDALRSACVRSVRLQPCLRDARSDHFLFANGVELSGLVDFGGMGVESVAADLARLMAEWLGDDVPRRREALDAYESVHPLDPAEIALIEPFERSAALLGPVRWIRWHLVEGRRFETSQAPLRRLERGVAKLERLAVGR